jgi:hypothetical protein
MLLLPEIQADESWELSNRRCSFGNQGPRDRKVAFFLTFNYSQLSTSRRCTLVPAYLCQKDERELPGTLHWIFFLLLLLMMSNLVPLNVFSSRLCLVAYSLSVERVKYKIHAHVSMFLFSEFYKCKRTSRRCEVLTAVREPCGLVGDYCTFKRVAVWGWEIW